MGGVSSKIVRDVGIKVGEEGYGLKNIKESISNYISKWIGGNCLKNEYEP